MRAVSGAITLVFSFGLSRLFYDVFAGAQNPSAINVFGGAASRSGFIGDTVASFAGSGPDVDLADDLGHGLDDLLTDLALRGIVVDTLPQGGNADLNLNFDET